MTEGLHILARGEAGWTELLIVGAVLLLSALGQLGKWLKKRAEEQAQQRRDEESPQPVSLEPARPGRLRRAQPTPPLPQRRAPVPPQRMPAPAAAPQAAPQALAGGVAAELHREAARRQREEQLRRRRLAAHKPPEADSAEIARRLVHVAPAAGAGEGAEFAGAAPDLSDPAAAREAIVMLEILLPPLALRRDEPSWER
ncbi:MAG TPA: hypothetical protein DCX07_12485 [Phycisphaerales bacterium]|nr:hypothetical protein [Phycisphaerales bacterium]